jgi:hypothetical protein
MSRKPPKIVNDLELWLLHKTGRIRLDGPHAEDFATVYEARLRASGAHTAFYVVPWTPEPIAFAGVTREHHNEAWLLTSALCNGDVDVVLHCTSPTEALITYGAPGDGKEYLVDMRYTPSSRIPQPKTKPTPTQFQALVAAINGGVYAPRAF